jgi:hypothetical protein
MLRFLGSNDAGNEVAAKQGRGKRKHGKRAKVEEVRREMETLGVAAASGYVVNRDLAIRAREG